MFLIIITWGKVGGKRGKGYWGYLITKTGGKGESRPCKIVLHPGSIWKK